LQEIKTKKKNKNKKKKRKKEKKEKKVDSNRFAQSWPEE
jgi:hypothetical protein